MCVHGGGTGFTAVSLNVTVYNGTCKLNVASPSANAYFASAGVTSSDGGLLIVGSSAGHVLFVNLATQQPEVDFILAPNSSIIGSPTTDPMGDETLVIIASTDGVVWALNSLKCVHNIIGQGCVVWSTNLTSPIMASTRLTYNLANNTALDNGVVLVSTTHAQQVWSGVLQCSAVR
jgi:hypothetical protein